METENKSSCNDSARQKPEKSSAFANLSRGEDLESSASDITRLLRTRVHCCLFFRVFIVIRCWEYSHSRDSLFSFPSEDVYRINYKGTTFNKADERFPVRRKRRKRRLGS